MCYDECRGDGDSPAQCLDDCEENIDSPEARRAIERRADRDDYDEIDGCEAKCRRVRGDDRAVSNCYIKCDNY